MTPCADCLTSVVGNLTVCAESGWDYSTMGGVTRLYIKNRSSAETALRH
jgi:hypothetical protein